MFIAQKWGFSQQNCHFTNQIGKTRLDIGSSVLFLQEFLQVDQWIYVVLVSAVTCYQLPPYQAVLQLSAVPFSKSVHCGAASTDRWHFHSSSTPLKWKRRPSKYIRIPCSLIGTLIGTTMPNAQKDSNTIHTTTHSFYQLLMSIMLRSRMINPRVARVTIFLGVRYITHTPTYGDYYILLPKFHSFASYNIYNGFLQAQLCPCFILVPSPCQPQQVALAF